MKIFIFQYDLLFEKKVIIKRKSKIALEKMIFKMFFDCGRLTNKIHFANLSVVMHHRNPHNALTTHQSASRCYAMRDVQGKHYTLL